MLPINKRTALFLSRMGARGVLGQAVYDMAKDGLEFYALSADLSTASGFDRLKKDYPDKFLNAGIAEANMLGMASGIASSNTPVIATTWATFASGRIADQVRNYMGFMKANVKLIGLDSGFENNRFGYSHTNGPDVAIMSSIPNIKVISPSDGMELYFALYSAMEYDGPVYIRLTGGQNLPLIHIEETYKFVPDHAEILAEGMDIALITYGSTLNTVLNVAEHLKEKGLSCSVINMHTIKPIDFDAIEKACKSSLIVTVEEHPLYGGLGSIISSYLVGKDDSPAMEIIASKDLFTPAGNYEYALSYNGLTEEDIIKRICCRVK